tara:strand:+ start:147 stop:845 length:699 start_codon:yes stop_codon:yes gene_type:complete
MIDNMDWFFDNLNSKTPFAFSRFNDGEMMGIDRVGSTVARGDQLVDITLSRALQGAITHRQENYFVGVPCSLCYPEYNELAMNLVGDDYEYLTSAVVTTNKNWKSFMDQFPTAVKDRRLLWIGGSDQNVDNLETIGLNVAKRGLVPNRNSWKFYHHIYTSFPKTFKKGDVVALSLGPTARILAKEWFEEMPDITFLDVGSNFDPYTRNVWHNCHKGWEETGFNLTKRCEECN